MTPPGAEENDSAFRLRPSQVSRGLRAIERAEAEPTPRDPEHPPNNLPLELSSFVGREKELAEVGRLLEDGRLLTLTGPGGSGKTRLALAAAGDLVGGFEDGAWLVDLASLADPALVQGAVASTLGVREQSGTPPAETLTGYL